MKPVGQSGEDPKPSALLRDLPSVDAVLRELDPAAGPHALLVAEARFALEALRRRLAAGEGPPAAPGAAEVAAQVRRAAASLERPSLRAVINATGVILHTNLGRAPLARAALDAAESIAGVYSNLEYDLERGKRGRRDVHAGRLLERILGAPALVVNNNAAAIFLVLNELAGDGETLVSRGELIEIGDGFRIPEIMERSGTRLREVGATNRTRIEDFSAALGPDTKAILRVHPSNFRMVGFTARPSLAELAALGRERGLPVIEDLGSGCLYDLAAHGVVEEPPVRASLEAGVEVVTFSGDKLLGGPQAGLIAGKRETLERIRRNPLFRALRADKLIYAALEATLREYLFERWDRIPALAMIRARPEALRERAERLAAALGAGAAVEAGESLLGGGSTPEQTLPTFLVAVETAELCARQSAGQGAKLSAAALERRLRAGDPPVLARVEKDRLLLDLRTVFPDQEEALAVALRQACAPE